MPQVTELVRSLSPLARLDEMHPTLAKYSIPSGGEINGGSHEGCGMRMRGVAGDEKEAGTAPAGGRGGLSLAAAFESIERRKEGLQVNQPVEHRLRYESHVYMYDCTNVYV